MLENFSTIAIAVVVALVTIAGVGFIVTAFYKKVEQGRALIINRLGKDPVVTFTGGLVLPVIHKSETMDISVKTIEIDRRGHDGLICRDNIRADIKVTFFVKVNKTTDDVMRVAQQVGCMRASDQDTLEELFQAKFSEALKTAGKKLDFEELYTQRQSFKDQIIETIGTDLNGYVLDDAAIDYLEQTPLKALDANNILDAQGIRKITELTTGQNVLTNQLRQEERKAMKKQDVEAEEAVLALERQEADARARQAREIATVKDREEAEQRKIQAEEFQRSELARIRAEEDIQVNEENMGRQIEIAKKNRERAIAVETERVEKDRVLEAIARERETELVRIAKEKELEVEKKAIADVIRTRIAVEKTVAEEEERIKQLRVVEEAKRTKESQVILASADAEEKMIKQVKAAEAAEFSAKHTAQEKLTMANATLEAAELEAKAKIRLAEGQQAEVAAEGLAAARVKEADAVATEKKGLADARVRAEQAKSEAAVVRERLEAEAKGLAEKFEAMRALEGVVKEHEEFRFQLEKDREIELARIEAQKDIAQTRAAILKEAFHQAKINIVGGNGEFFDKFVNAISVGQSLDGFVDQSERARQLFAPYLDGQQSLPAELMSAVGNLGSGGVQNLSISAFLAKLMAAADPATRAKLQNLAEQARKLGVDTPPMSVPQVNGQN